MTNPTPFEIWLEKEYRNHGCIDFGLNDLQEAFEAGMRQIEKQVAQIKYEENLNPYKNFSEVHYERNCFMRGYREALSRVNTALKLIRGE